MCIRDSDRELFSHAHLFFNFDLGTNLHTAILRTSFGSLIVRHRLGLAVADRSDAVLVHALIDQIGFDRRSAPFRQLLNGALRLSKPIWSIRAWTRTASLRSATASPSLWRTIRLPKDVRKIAVWRFVPRSKLK